MSKRDVMEDCEM